MKKITIKGNGQTYIIIFPVTHKGCHGARKQLAEWFLTHKIPEHIFIRVSADLIALQQQIGF